MFQKTLSARFLPLRGLKKNILLTFVLEKLFCQVSILKRCSLFFDNYIYSKTMIKNSNISVTKQSLPTRGLKNSASQWTKEKAERDGQLWGNQSGLWIVQNKLYDLSGYIDKHPGGKHWLIMTKGQDITQYFITHHLNQDKARQVLDKYYIGPTKVQQEPRFTFGQDGLYRAVKKKLLSKYTPEQLQDTSQSTKIGILFLFLWALSFILTGVFQSYLLAIVCGLLIYPNIGVAHNFIHIKDHPLRFLWLITGFTHRQWQQMHCISHHTFSNTLIDLQIQAFEPIVFYLKATPKNKAINWILKQITLLMLTPFNILLKLLVKPLRKGQQPEWFYIFPLLQLPLLWIMTRQISLSVQLFFIIHMSFSAFFSKLTFLGHRTGYEWTAGNTQIKDFAEHQISASSDTPTQGCRGFLSYLLFAGFNYHAVHHLFPTIDNYQLPAATFILEKQAENKGVKLNKIKGVFWALLEIEKNFFHRKQWHKKQ